MRFSTDVVHASLLFTALVAVGSAQDTALEKVIVSYQTELSAVAHSSKSIYSTSFPLPYVGILISQSSYCFTDLLCLCLGSYSV